MSVTSPRSGWSAISTLMWPPPARSSVRESWDEEDPLCGDLGLGWSPEGGEGSTICVSFCCGDGKAVTVGERTIGCCFWMGNQRPAGPGENLFGSALITAFYRVSGCPCRHGAHSPGVESPYDGVRSVVAQPLVGRQLNGLDGDPDGLNRDQQGTRTRGARPPSLVEGCGVRNESFVTSLSAETVPRAQSPSVHRSNEQMHRLIPPLPVGRLGPFEITIPRGREYERGHRPVPCVVEMGFRQGFPPDEPRSQRLSTVLCGEGPQGGTYPA